jgi:hypothetical protein
VHDFTDSPSRSTVQAPHDGRVAADVRRRQAEGVAQVVHEQQARLDVRVRRHAVDGDVDLHELSLAAWIASHTRRGVAGMSMCPYAEVRHGVDDGVLDGRGRADGPRLADALHAQRVEVRRGRHVEEGEAGQLGRRREAVVGEAGGQRVAVGVEHDLFEQRLGDALGDPAVPLPLGDQRVEHRPGVVHGDDLVDDRLAGLDVDLDDGQVRTEGERGGAGVERGLRPQRLGLGEPAERDRGARTAHPHRAPRPPRGRRPRPPARPPRAAWPARPARPRPGPPRRRRSGRLREPIVPAPRGTRSVSPCRTVIISMGTPEVLAREHRPGRRVALPVRRGAGEHGDRAVRVHLDRGVLGERAATGDLDERGEADAELDGVATLRGARPARPRSSA